MDLQSTGNLFIENYKSHYNELAKQSVIKQAENLKNIQLEGLRYKAVYLTWQKGSLSG
jgi:hypothetical protein